MYQAPLLGPKKLLNAIKTKNKIKLLKASNPGVQHSLEMLIHGEHTKHTGLTQTQPETSLFAKTVVDTEDEVTGNCKSEMRFARVPSTGDQEEANGQQSNAMSYSEGLSKAAYMQDWTDRQQGTGFAWQERTVCRSEQQPRHSASA